MELILQYLFCCQFTESEIIKDLFEDLATNVKKCPITNKLSVYTDNHYKLYLDVLKHFKIVNECENMEVNSIKNWSSIRKKSLKDLIIKNFIIKVKNDYIFDDSIARNLKRDLLVALNFKKITDKHIVIHENKIVDIIGLKLEKNSYNLTFS